MVGRDLRLSEASLSVVERCLVVVVRAFCHLARYTIYFPFMIVVFQSTKELKVVCGDAVHEGGSKSK